MLYLFIVFVRCTLFGLCLLLYNILKSGRETYGSEGIERGYRHHADIDSEIRYHGIHRVEGTTLVLTTSVRTEVVGIR